MLARCAIFGLVLVACSSSPQPPVVNRACPAATAPAITLADAVDYAEFVAVDGARVYWQSRSGVFSIAKDGSDLRQLPLTPPVGQNLPQFDQQRSGGIAVDKAHIYFAVAYAVYRMPKEGGQLENVGTTGANGLIGQIALDDSYVYWVDEYYGAVYKAGKGAPYGTNQPPLVTAGRRPRYLAIDHDYVYWSNEDDVNTYRVGKDGSGLTTLLPGVIAAGLAVDDTKIYWVTDMHGVYSADKATGLNVTTLYPSSTLRAFGLAQDASRLYFPLGAGYGAIGKDGTGFTGDPGQAIGTTRAIAVDAEAVYWGIGLGDGTIEKACVVTDGVPADPSGNAIDVVVPVEGPPGTVAMTACPTAAVVDDTDAFAVTFPETTDPRNKLVRVALAGGATVTLDDNVNAFGLSQLASWPTLSATHVYWVRSALTPIVGSSPQWRYSVRRITKAGDTPEAFTLPSADSISELMIDATHIYWFGADALFGQAFGETTPTMIASVPAQTYPGKVGQTLLDGDTIYFEKGGRLYSIGKDGSNLLQLQDALLPPGGGAPYGIAGLEADATHLYWTYSGSSNAHDKLMRLAKSGGTAEELSTGMQSLYDLAVDDTNVYWRLYGVGDVYVVPKVGGARATLTQGGIAGAVYSSVVIAQGRLWWTSCAPSAMRSVAL
jgi:hypothetical protein